jgi:hypothetical protein
MDFKKLLPRGVGLLLLVLSAGVSGQQITFKSTCTQASGLAGPEQLRDKDGQSFSVGGATCRVVGGPLDGAITTSQTIWHYPSRGIGKMVVNAGVTRGAAAQAVWVATEATITLQPGGFVGEGKGVYRVASGAASMLEGRSFHFKFRSTAPGQYDHETVMD